MLTPEQRAFRDIGDWFEDGLDLILFLFFLRVDVDHYNRKLEEDMRVELFSEIHR